jgi:hypothetical protein
MNIQYMHMICNYFQVPFIDIHDIITCKAYFLIYKKQVEYTIINPLTRCGA